MHHPVFSQSTFFDETFAAELARERSISAVDSLVIDHVSFVSEGFAANGTLVRFHAKVIELVVVMSLPGGKHSPAMFASVVRWGYVILDVASKLRLYWKSLITHMALKWLFIQMLRSGVSYDGPDGRQFVATVIAFVHQFSNVGTLVALQTAHELERLSTFWLIALVYQLFPHIPDVFLIFDHALEIVAAVHASRRMGVPVPLQVFHILCLRCLFLVAEDTHIPSDEF